MKFNLIEEVYSFYDGYDKVKGLELRKVILIIIEKQIPHERVIYCENKVQRKPMTEDKLEKM